MGRSALGQEHWVEPALSRETHLPWPRGLQKRWGLQLPSGGAMARKKPPPWQFPTAKDKERLSRGEQWAFAEGARAKQWVCEEEVEVLIVEPPEGRDPGACCGNYHETS